MNQRKLNLLPRKRLMTTLIPCPMIQTDTVTVKILLCEISISALVRSIHA